MKITQLYETWIADRDSTLSARAVVLPLGSIAEDALPDDLPGLTESLGLEVVTPVGPSSLVPSLALCVADSEVGGFRAPRSGDALDEGLREVPDAHYVFAEYVVYARCLPVERSPLEAESLASLVTTATGRGMGAFAAYCLAGDDPVLFATTPAGLILAGAAEGIGGAMEAGLRDRLLGLVRGPGDGEGAGD